jgi:hypothetical protein
LAAHSCGNGHLGCVNPRHLRWATAKENAHDELLHGRKVYGEASPKAKVTSELVLAVRALKGKKSGQAVADLFGIPRSSVYGLWAGQTWKHLLDIEAEDCDIVWGCE